MIWRREHTKLYYTNIVSVAVFGAALLVFAAVHIWFEDMDLFVFDISVFALLCVSGITSAAIDIFKHIRRRKNIEVEGY